MLNQRSKVIDPEENSVEREEDAAKGAGKVRAAMPDAKAEDHEHKNHEREKLDEEDRGGGKSSRRHRGGGSGNKKDIEDVGTDDIAHSKVAPAF